MTDTVRMKLLTNVDSHLEPTITEDENDARKFIPYLIDRLRINPPLNSVERALQNFRQVEFKDSSQGFSLGLRVKGGPGRVLTTFLMQFGGVTHIMTVKSVSLDSKTLRLLMYQNRKRSTQELRLSAFHRTLLLGTDDDYYFSWIHRLRKRLRLDWRGSHSLKIDLTLYKSVRKVRGRSIFFNVALDPQDQTVAVATLFDPLLCKTFTHLFDCEEFVRLLFYHAKKATKSKNKKRQTDQSPDAESNEKADRAMRRIADAQSDSGALDDIDPSEFRVPFVERLQSHANLVMLVDRLETLLERQVRCDHVLRVFNFIIFQLALL